MIGQGNGIKLQNGYRQLGLIGSFVNTNSYRDCGPAQNKPGGGILNKFIQCIEVNDKVGQQNDIQLATKVLELTKR